MATNQHLEAPPESINGYKVLAHAPKLSYALGEGWVIMCQNDDGMYVVASWYPGYGDSSWHSGEYRPEYNQASALFKEMMK